MFARLVKLQLGLLKPLDPTEVATLTLPQRVITSGEIKASMGDLERPALFALYAGGSGLILRLYLATSLYVEATLDTHPRRRGDDIEIGARARVFKNNTEILSGPWDGTLKVWRPGDRIMSICMEVRDLNVVLDGVAFQEVIEANWCRP